MLYESQECHLVWQPGNHIFWLSDMLLYLVPAYDVHSFASAALSAPEATTKPPMSPYRPKASAKMGMRIMPTNNRGCWALARTPASPTIPMARPAARELKPTV